MNNIAGHGNTLPMINKTAQAKVKAPKVGFVSLGCPKALVDSERIITRLRSEGYELSQEYQGSDVVIVNTCGFLDSARDESLEAIGEAINENGRVIVTGCLGAEPDVIRQKHPKVLAITGPQQYEDVLREVHNVVPPAHDPFLDLVPAEGMKLTPRHYAYMKISEGCNNRCTFCIIPALRGDLVSRRIDNVMKEAERLAAAGVKELLVISQDTSAYGLDLKYEKATWRGQEYETRFYDLCQALGELGIWVRMHYVYPYPHVDKAIELMAEGKILPYLDIPFQHASPNVLRNMKRPAHHEKTLDRLKEWRDICPELTIRSTFIVGFPGETEEDFEFLLQWLEEAQIDRLGCFKYEPVKGATSEDLGLEEVPADEKDDRWNTLMQLQQDISAEKMQAKIGTTQQVIVDEYDAKEKTIIARSKADAPEIDGNVFIDSDTSAKPGDFLNVKITDADEYDLYGSIDLA